MGTFVGTFRHHSWENTSPSKCRHSQKTRDIHPLRFQCWASVEGGGPTLKKQWVNVLCLLGLLVREMKRYSAGSDLGGVTLSNVEIQIVDLSPYRFKKGFGSAL